MKRTRVLSAFLAALMCFLCIGSFALYNSDYDVNGDGEVGVADLSRLMNFIAGREVTVHACDMNGDGETNVKDLTRLMEYLSVGGEIESDYIEISSEDELYALSRLLQISFVKNNYISKDASYSAEDDFNKFTYPAEIQTNAEKIAYLQTASYKLMSDVALTIQKVNSADYFTGIGSSNYPFKGRFNGNGKTVSLTAAGALDFGDIQDYGTGLFDTVENAEIFDLTVDVGSDITVTSSVGATYIGIIAGNSTSSAFSGCTVNIFGCSVGADYDSAQSLPTSIGGIVGQSTLSAYKNCHVVLENASITGYGTTITDTRKYGVVTIGGIIGFSVAGSNNSSNIGRLGNQIYDCSFTAKNDVKQNVLSASIESGNEVTAGGIVGCTFNNIVIKNCSVNITKGNISAIKTAVTDSAEYGTQAGGIIGRMEHTGEVSHCYVTGDHLSIFSKSPNNTSGAGGIAGVDMGPYHRDIDTINNSHFDGLGTSDISVEITSSDTLSRSEIIAAGGIVGNGSYIISNCSVKNTTIINRSAGIGNPTSYAGKIFGFMAFDKVSSDIFGAGYNWYYNTFFKKRSPGLYNCTAENVTVVKTDNVQNLPYNIN